MNKAIKVKSAFPEQTFSTLEKKVLTAYKKDIRNGQEPPKCKATLSAIQDLVREMTRYENELNEFAKPAIRRCKSRLLGGGLFCFRRRQQPIPVELTGGRTYLRRRT